MLRQAIYCFVSILLLIPPVSADTISLTWVTDDTPGGTYIIGGGSGFHPQNPGIEIELYQMVARSLGFELKLKRLPWKQCLYLIGKNRVDGIFPASYKPERMKIGVYPMHGQTVDPSRKTRNNAYFLYKANSSPISWDGSRIVHARGPVGVPSGWAVVDDLRAMGLELEEMVISPTAPNLLIHGRLQGFICLETVFDAYLADNPDAYAGIVKIHPPIWEKPYYLMLSHALVNQSPHLAEAVWEKIREIKQSEAFGLILRRYLH